MCTVVRVTPFTLCAPISFVCSVLHETRNLSFLRFHRHRHPVVSTCSFTGMVRVGVKIPQDGNRTNTYSRVATVHEHIGARFAVFVRRARVLPGPCHATRNLS